MTHNCLWCNTPFEAYRQPLMWNVQNLCPKCYVKYCEMWNQEVPEHIQQLVAAAGKGE